VYVRILPTNVGDLAGDLHDAALVEVRCRRVVSAGEARSGRREQENQQVMSKQISV
jgi:hypothetical protein